MVDYHCPSSNYKIKKLFFTLLVQKEKKQNSVALMQYFCVKGYRQLNKRSFNLPGRLTADYCLVDVDTIVTQHACRFLFQYDTNKKSTAHHFMKKSFY